MPYYPDVKHDESYMSLVRRNRSSVRGFRPGTTQNWLYNYRRWLDALNFVFRKLRDCTIYAAKTKASLFSHMQKNGFLTTRLISFDSMFISLRVYAYRKSMLNLIIRESRVNECLHLL